MMKRFAISLATLVTAVSLSVTAQAATKNTQQCICKTGAKTKVVKKTPVKKAVVKKAVVKKTATKKAVRTGEININIPADLRIDEKNNAVAVTNTQVQRPNTSVVVPVTRVVPTAPATKVVSVTPVSDNTAKRTVTTTVPVAVETVPVVVPVNP